MTKFYLRANTNKNKIWCTKKFQIKVVKKHKIETTNLLEYSIPIGKFIIVNSYFSKKFNLSFEKIIFTD